MRVMPIWVTFHQLPLIYWGERSIGKIASVIGKIIMRAKCTSKKLWVSYARVLIEVDIKNELKDHITIRDPQDKKPIQPVEYEWRHAFCKVCNKVGNNYEQKERENTKKNGLKSHTYLNLA